MIQLPFIKNVLTNPEYRQMGVATDLLKHIEKRYRKQHDYLYLHVLKSNTQALNLYKKFNFIEFGLGATRSNIVGSSNSLILRSQQNNLTGSVQCGATDVIVNNVLTFDDSSASQSLIKTSSTAIHLEANYSVAATPQITIDDTAISLARNTRPLDLHSDCIELGRRRLFRHTISTNH